jgi:fluoroacetyl-CoA thioesterase
MLNKSFSQTIVVIESHTAEKVGSGGLPVFSTPSLVALMENTAMQMFDSLDSNSTSVGTEIHVKHLKPSAVGAIIKCEALCVNVDGRKYDFDIKAFDADAQLIGEGFHSRFVVDVERFMSKIIKDKKSI